MKFMGILSCVMGCLMIYCSHHHQSILKKSLVPICVHIGLILLILSLILLWITLPKLVAVFIWLMTMITFWSLLPFIALLKKNNLHEHDLSTKNPS